MRIRKEIPYYLITDVPEDPETIVELKKNPYRNGFVLFFRVSRKFDSRSKSSLNYNSVRFNNLKTTGGLRSIKIENTGFKLSLDEHGRLKIKHRDLPDIDGINYIFKCSYPYQIIDIITSSGFMVNNEIKGSFYYDYNSGTFKLEDRSDGSYLERRRIGKLLESKKTKLEKGHNYLIELGPGSLRPIEATYFGELSNVLLPKTWRPYIVEQLTENDFNRLCTLRRINAHLFRDLDDNTYFLTDRRDIRGIDLGVPTTSIPSLLEIKKFAIDNKYAQLIDDRDCLISMIKDTIKSKLISSNNIVTTSNSSFAIKAVEFGVTDPETICDFLDEVVIKDSYWYLTPRLDCIGRLYDETIPGITSEERLEIIKTLV